MFSISFKTLMTLCMLDSVITIPKEMKNDLDNVCGLDLTKPQSFKSLVDSVRTRETVEDCHHSIGFQVSKELCRTNGFVAQKTSTIYISDQNIVLFINIPANLSDTSRKSWRSYVLDWRYVEKGRKSLTEEYIRYIGIKEPLFMIRVREGNIESGHQFNVRYDSKEGNQKEVSIKTQDSDHWFRFDEQILLKDLRIYTEQKLDIQLSANDGKQSSDQFTVDTYLILCLKTRNEDPNCKPSVNKERIWCECDVRDKLTTLIFYLILWFFCILIVTKPIVFMLLYRREKQTDVAISVNCNPKNARYIYVVFLRLAKGTADFDLNDVHIDIQFFSKNEPIGGAARFSASPLEDQFVGQIRVFIFRLTKMPVIDNIRANHNGMSDGRITIFGAFVFGSRGDEEYQKVYRINKDISRDLKDIPVLIADQNQELEDPSHLKSLDSFSVHLSFLELVWIIFVNISLISLIAIVVPNLFSDDMLILDMSVKVVVSALVTTLVNVIVLAIYKTLLRAELKQKILMNSKSENMYFIAIKIYIIALITLAVVIEIYFILTRTQKKDIETFRWLCVIFCATTLFILLWNIESHLRFGKSKGPSEPISVEETTSMMSVQSASVNDSMN